MTVRPGPPRPRAAADPCGLHSARRPATDSGAGATAMPVAPRSDGSFMRDQNRTGSPVHPGAFHQQVLGQQRELHVVTTPPAIPGKP